MKATKIVGFLTIAAILGGGLYLLQHKKQNKALIAHNTKKFQQITKAAKKSNSAGLLVMVSAINQYYKTKGNYPKDLSLLYPEFIPNESFILTLNWKYYPEKRTFLIKRSVMGSQSFYSMGPDMKLRKEIEEASSPLEKIAAIDAPKKSKYQPVFMDSKTKSASKKGIKKNQIVEVFLPNNRKSNDRKKISKPKPEFAIVKKELNKNEKFLLSFNGDNLYIWKTNEGIIGFSDIQYPDEKELTVYKNKNWVKYQYHQDSNENKTLLLQSKGDLKK